MTQQSSAVAIRDIDSSPVSTAGNSLPAVVDKKALKSYLALINDPEALDLQRQLAGAYDKAVAALIGENDVQKEGARTFKKKSAWRKLGRYFGISTVVVSRDERFLIDESTGESVFIATCTVRGTAPWGQTIDGVAACGTDEETGRRKITIADAIATAETRATNRATSSLIAMGEVSAEELSRDGRAAAVEASVEEMTLDEAKAVAFPWRQPEKYRDKPLSELSTSVLESVRDTVAKDLESKGKTPKLLELSKAVALILADRVKNPSQGEQQQGGGEGGAAGAVAAVVNVPVPPCPKCSKPMSDDRLTKTNPKAPDYKCTDANCDGLYWAGQYPPKPLATDEQKAKIRELLVLSPLDEKDKKKIERAVANETKPMKGYRADEIITELAKTIPAQPAAAAPSQEALHPALKDDEDDGLPF